MITVNFKIIFTIKVTQDQKRLEISKKILKDKAKSITNDNFF